MRYLSEIMNWVSSSLMLPDMVLLLAAMGFALIELGGFCSAWVAQLRHKREREDVMNSLRENRGLGPWMSGEGVFTRHLRELASVNWDPVHCEKLIFDFSQRYERELERSRFMMKLGPMLGLMGTLIPMGPALAGLASGDVASMAFNMQIAFGTTVVGIFVAGVGLLLHSVKRHWFTEEIACLRYALDVHLTEVEKHDKNSSL